MRERMNKIVSLFIFSCSVFYSCIATGEEPTADKASGESPDKAVIVEMVKRGSYTEKDILEHYNGCNEDLYQWKVLCINYADVKSDLQLNDIYKKLQKKINGTSAEKKLTQAQRAWLAFRDVSCIYENDGYADGRMAYLMETSCKVRYTEERSQKLNEYLTCEDGGCPGLQ
jgi:uncharacterized protein YecT (DUF1311 family)